MEKIIKRPNSFANYEFEYLESYLEEKARQGLVLKKAGRWILIFEKTQPCEMKYRILPGSASITEEEMESLEAKGWKLVSEENMMLLANEDKNADELLSEGAVIKELIKKYQRETRIKIIGTVSWISIFIAIAVKGLAYCGVLHSIEMDGLSGLLPYILILSVCLIDIAVYCIKLRKILKRLKKGTIHSSSVDGVKRAKRNVLNGIVLLVAAIFLIGNIVYMSIDSDVPMRTIKEEIDNTKGQIKSKEISHPVSLKIFDPGSYNELQNKLALVEKDLNIAKDEDTGEIRPPSFLRDDETSFLFRAKKYEEADSESVRSDNKGSFYCATYYYAKTEWIAKKYLEEEIKNHVDKTSEKIAFDLLWADYAGYSRDKWGYDNLFIRKGKKAEYVTYRGSKNLKKNADLFLEDLMLYGTWELCGFVEEGKQISKKNILGEKEYKERFDHKIPDSKITLDEKGIVEMEDVPGEKREQLKRLGKNRYLQTVTITIIDKKKLDEPLIEYTKYTLKDGYLFSEITYSDKIYNGGNINVYKKIK